MFSGGEGRRERHAVSKFKKAINSVTAIDDSKSGSIAEEFMR